MNSSNRISHHSFSDGSSVTTIKWKGNYRFCILQIYCHTTFQDPVLSGGSDTFQKFVQLSCLYCWW